VHEIDATLAAEYVAEQLEEKDIEKVYKVLEQFTDFLDWFTKRGFVEEGKQPNWEDVYAIISMRTGVKTEEINIICLEFTQYLAMIGAVDYEQRNDGPCNS